MKKISTLNSLPIGKTATIIKLNVKGAQRRRLLDLGITKEARIEAVQRSPYCNPTAYFVKGSLVALRNEDAKNILIVEERG